MFLSSIARGDELFVSLFRRMMEMYPFFRITNVSLDHVQVAYCHFSIWFFSYSTVDNRYSRFAIISFSVLIYSLGDDRYVANGSIRIVARTSRRQTFIFDYVGSVQDLYVSWDRDMEAPCSQRDTTWDFFSIRVSFNDSFFSRLRGSFHVYLTSGVGTLRVLIFSFFRIFSSAIVGRDRTSVHELIQVHILYTQRTVYYPSHISSSYVHVRLSISSYARVDSTTFFFRCVALIFDICSGGAN